eukprot:861478-Pelagomonas_calceolata.AAC.4
MIQDELLSPGCTHAANTHSPAHHHHHAKRHDPICMAFSVDARAPPTPTRMNQDAAFLADAHAPSTPTCMIQDALLSPGCTRAVNTMASRCRTTSRGARKSVMVRHSTRWPTYA